MHTTLTLDDDIEAKLRAEARHSERSFRETVNDVMRRGLAIRRPALSTWVWPGRPWSNVCSLGSSHHKSMR
jgi:hypothetical protein